MKLKTFTAPTIFEAMRRVRREAGEDALILETTESEKESTISVMIPDSPLQDLQNQIEHHSDLKKQSPPAATKKNIYSLNQIIESINTICEFHQPTLKLRTEWLNTFLKIHTNTSDNLEKSIKPLLGFDSNWIKRLSTRRALVLVGPPGSGKTLSVAKLAAWFLSQGRNVKLIGGDTLKSGAIDQLSAYATAMGLKAVGPLPPSQLQTVLSKTALDTLVLVDSFSVNPHEATEVERLEYLLKSTPTTSLLTLPAGLSAENAIETAKIFVKLGARHLLPTQLDTVHRYGGFLSAGFEHKLCLVGYTARPTIGEGLYPLSSNLLTKLLKERMGNQNQGEAA